MEIKCRSCQWNMQMEMQVDPAQVGAQITWQSEEREPETKMNLT